MDVDFEALRYRGASRERCYELFTRLAFRTLVNDYAPTADTIQKDYHLVTSLDELDALVAALRAAREFALPRDTRSAERLHDRDRRHRVLHRRPSGALSAARPRRRGCVRRSARRRHDARAGERPRGARPSAAALRRRGHQQGRPRSEVRPRRPLTPRHHAPRAGLRFDARQLPARCDPAGPSARRDIARASGLQGADRGRRVRPRRQGGCPVAAVTR